MRATAQRDRLALAYEFARDLTPADPSDLAHPAATAGHPFVTALSLVVATVATPIAIGTALTSHRAGFGLIVLAALAGLGTTIATIPLWKQAARRRQNLLAEERRTLQAADPAPPKDTAPPHTPPPTGPPAPTPADGPATPPTVQKKHRPRWRPTWHH